MNKIVKFKILEEKVHSVKYSSEEHSMVIYVPKVLLAAIISQSDNDTKREKVPQELTVTIEVAQST